MRILLIQTAFAGDALLASSLVADLSDRYPMAALDVLVRQGNEALYADHPRVSRVWVWDKGRGKYAHLLKLARALRAERFDRVYNLQRHAATGYLTWRSGAPFRAGFSGSPFSALLHRRLRHRLPWPSPEGDGFLHEVQRNRLLLDPRPAPPRRPEIYPDARSRERAEAIAAGRPVVVLAPASQWFTKQWPAEQWRRLMATIPAALRVVLIGGPGDRPLADALLDAHPDAVNACGELDVRGSAALMRLAWRVYANDSLPVHLASAVDAPCTAIFCSTRPELGFGPLSRDARVVTSPTPCCSPGLHGARRCKAGHFRCALDIDAAAVTAPDLPVWEAALALREGRVVRLVPEGGQAWVARLADRPAAAEAARGTGPEATLWFRGPGALARHLPEPPVSLKPLLAAAAEAPARFRLDGLHGLAPGAERLPLAVGGPPAWSTWLRCAGGPVMVCPETGERPAPADAHEWTPPPGLPPAPPALLRWDGETWRLEQPGPVPGAYRPWAVPA